MMLITEMVPLSGKRSKKIKISFDDGSTVILYSREASRYRLKEGTEVDKEIWNRLMEEIFIPRAKSRAMHLLERQDRTKLGLKKKLKECGYPTEAIERALAYVESYHYIDDGRYAASYVRYHQYGKSRRRIEMDLRAKGVSDELIERAIDTEFTISEEDMIKKTLEKRNYDHAKADHKERQRMYRFLLGRGFAYEDIDRVLRTVVA